MKLRFKKDVSVDFRSKRLQEWVDHTFHKDEIVEAHVITYGGWSDMAFPNGDLAESVKSDSFEVLA
jgi:hypothetical protein